MHIYIKLHNDIQYKIDSYIKENIKCYYKHNILLELNNFHKNKLIKNIFKYYINCNISGYDIILHDIFCWLNHPYSQNMDTPFMTGHITNKFINIVKKINKKNNNILSINDNGIYLNNNILELFINNIIINKKLTIKYILFKIFNKLTYKDIEEFYIYITKSINIYNQLNIINISSKFN